MAQPELFVVRMKAFYPERMTALLLFLLTAAVFSPALFCGYVAFDDASYAAENPYVLSGLSVQNLRWALEEHNGFRSPLLWISYMLDSTLLAPEPWAFHLTNVLLHAGSAALFFLLLVRMTGRAGPAFAAAALWALHPLRVESVAWITERKDVLSGLFFFLALHAYGSFARTRRRLPYLLVLLCMVSGLMVKPILVTLPVLLLLLDVWPLRIFSRDWKKRLAEKIPLFACAFFFTVIGWLAHDGAMSSLETFTLAERLRVAVSSPGLYLAKTLRPFGLAAPYPMTVPSPAEAFRIALLLGGITGAAAVSLRRSPWIFTGWLWFGIALFPVCGLIQIGNTTMADRFTYLPSVGLTIALVWSAASLKRLPFKKEGAAVLIAGLVLLSVRQIGFWRSSDTFFLRALAVAEDNPVARAHYGGWLAEQGRLEEAGPHLLQAVRRFPDYSPAVNNLGLWFFKRGDVQRALACFEAAVANPKHSQQAQINLDACRRLIEAQKKEMP